MMRAKILFVDDDAAEWARRFRPRLEGAGFELQEESDPERALQRISDDRPHIVLLDNLFSVDGEMRPLGGLILKSIATRYPDIPVVMFTSSLELDADETDFPDARGLFTKSRFVDAPHEADTELAEQLHVLLSARRQGMEDLDSDLGFVVGDTAAMRLIAREILDLAPRRNTVLLAGERGTGKELAARALHLLSGRKGSFIGIDCGRYAGDTAEREIFGHEKGAFTGAGDGAAGLLEIGDGGTVFLDEIQAMPPGLQDKLLRAIQTGLIRRMGATKDKKIDVRIISATNADLSQLVSSGRLRADLYDRLAGTVLRLPPLRERLSDLPALASAIIAELNSEMGLRISPKLSDRVLGKLSVSDWPGNIRVLRDVIYNAMRRTRANMLTPGIIELPEGMAKSAEEARSAGTSALLAENFAEAALRGQESYATILERFKGSMRRDVFAAVYNACRTRTGSEPTGPDIADVIGIDKNTFRQALVDFGGMEGLRARARELRGDS
jgi:DNA-binding NtrC family response regulator